MIQERMLANDRIEEPGQAVVELRGVTRRFGAKIALDNVSLNVPVGSVLGLVGENGIAASGSISYSYSTSGVSGDLLVLGGGLIGYASMGDVSYTFAKGVATQGGDLAAYYLAAVGNTQDFWNPEGDRAPVDNDIRHRVTISAIYELPTVGGGKGIVNGIVGDWQLASIITVRTGTALSVAQASGITQSRPDIVAGVDPIMADWEHTNVYLNTAAFVRVPVSSVTQATLRAGTYIPGMVYGPGSHSVNLTLAKNFNLHARTRLQVRIDGFNILNTKNLSNPVLGITASNFGVITGVPTGSSRTAQVGARLTF